MIPGSRLHDAGEPIDPDEPVRAEATHPELVVLVDAHVARVAELESVRVDVVDDAFVHGIRKRRTRPRPRLHVAIPARRVDSAVAVSVNAAVELGQADVRDSARTTVTDPDAAVEGNRCPR